MCGRAGWGGGRISSTLLLTFLPAVEVGCVGEAKWKSAWVVVCLCPDISFSNRWLPIQN